MMCIYCGDRVGIVCDLCASTAKERDEARAEVVLLRKLCRERPRISPVSAGVFNLKRSEAFSANTIEALMWIEKIDAEGGMK